MYQILEVWSKIQKKSDFSLVEARTYKVAYPQNSGCNTNRKYEKDIGYKSDIVVLYRKKESENPDMYRYLFRGVNIVIGAW